MSTRKSGEEITYQAHYHWALLLRPGFYVLLMLVLLAAWYLSERRLEALAANAEAWANSRLITQIALWVGLGYSMVLIIVKLVAFAMAEFKVTAKRIVGNPGLLRRAIDVPLRKVEKVSVEQGPLGRQLDYGTVVVKSKGGLTQRFPLIASPAEFRDAIEEQAEAE